MVHLVICLMLKEKWVEITICLDSWKVSNGRRLERKMTVVSETRNLGFRHVSKHVRLNVEYEDMYLHVNVYQNVSIRQTFNI